GHRPRGRFCDTVVLRLPRLVQFDFAAGVRAPYFPLLLKPESKPLSPYSSPFRTDVETTSRFGERRGVSPPVERATGGLTPRRSPEVIRAAILRSNCRRQGTRNPCGTIRFVRASVRSRLTGGRVARKMVERGDRDRPVQKQRAGP